MKVFVLFCLVAGAFASVVTERPGVCPVGVTVPEPVFGECTNDCDTDVACTVATQKCCDTNCGKKCLDSVVSPLTEEEENKTREEIANMLTTILSERRDLVKKLEMYPPPRKWAIDMKNRTDMVRMCVTSLCEMRKCQRIAATLTYKVTPRKEWKCQLATSTEHCLFWAERGWTDTVVARENKVFIAKDKFNVTGFAFEKKDDAPTEIEKKIQNITLAVTLSSTSIDTFTQLTGRKVCSGGINMTASFITPVCNLIHKNVINPTGDVVETASDFFGDMCVPGVLNKTFDKNETYPDKLIKGCGNKEVEYTGLKGSLKCLSSGSGEISFVDSEAVRTLIEMYPDVFKLVCEDESLPLTEWQQTKCHLGYTPRPVLFMNPERNTTYKNDIRTIIEEMSKAKVPAIDFFDSTDYNCLVGDNKNLIFMDENTKLEFLDNPLDIPQVQDYYQVFNTCKALVPKPRAKICTTTPVQYEKCITMKKVFQKDDQLKNISWGCVLARTEMDCMRNVLNGTADLYSGDLKEIFIAGHDFNLQPMMIQDEELRFQKSDFLNETVKSYTIAVMKKSKFWKKFGHDTKFVNIRNLTVCTPDIKSVPHFHLPIGHLLSMGIIPRIGSVFESVSRFYKSACMPGASPVEFTWDSDLILGHEVNWGVPGLSFYNFTGFDWFVWNSPHTWNFYNYNRKTPGTLKKFMQNRMLIPLLEGKLTVPEGFNPDTFDYTILDDVLSVEGLGDILNDIPDEIRDSLVDIRSRKVDRTERFRELYKEKTGDNFISLRDRRLGKLTLRGFLQQSFQNMEDEWGIFDDVNRPMMTTSIKSRHGHKVTSLRDILHGVSTSADDTTAINNLLKEYDSEYTVPVITRVFAKLLTERFDTLDGMAKTLEILHRVPTMTSTTGEDFEWLKHPSVQAYMRIYAPRLINFYSDLYDDTEIVKKQFSRYLNPIWLSPDFQEFLDVTKTHMTKLTEVCRGFGDRKGVGNSNEPFFGTGGSLTCIEDTEAGDITFIETTTLDGISNVESDYVMVTPAGIVQPLNRENIINGSFGTVPFPAIMTSFNKTGTWRWNVTRALLIAQKTYSTNQTTAGYTMFGENSVLKPKTKKLYPVPLNMQTHPTYLGPKLTRSFEAIIKPSTHDWWKERRHICSGETYTNVIEQNNGTCKAIVKDVTCTGLPRPKVISVGTTENKQPVVVRMCSRPTRFIREMAEFRCDNGHGYVKPVMVPTTCECMPCEEVEYIPTWTTDRMWTVEDREHIVTENLEHLMPLWGNEEFWVNHDLNTNFDIGVDVDDTTTTNNPVPVIKPVGTCEGVWYGKGWNPEWFANTTEPVCLGTVTGLRRVLTSQRMETKIVP